jgi:hypothetical protein
MTVMVLSHYRKSTARQNEVPYALLIRRALFSQMPCFYTTLYGVDFS